jgi:hypothetical protein
MTPHKRLIQLIKSKNYEPIVKELSEYNVTEFKSATFHFSLFVDKLVFLVGSTIEYDNFGNTSVYKERKRENKVNPNSSLYTLDTECILKFEYKGNLNVKNYERIYVFYNTAYIYREENHLVVYFKYSQPIEKKVYL